MGSLAYDMNTTPVRLCVTLGLLCCAKRWLPCVYNVTWWSGSGGTEAWSHRPTGLLQFCGYLECRNRPEMTYNVSRCSDCPIHSPAHLQLYSLTITLSFILRLKIESGRRRSRSSICTTSSCLLTGRMWVGSFWCLVAEFLSFFDRSYCDSMSVTKLCCAKRLNELRLCLGRGESYVLDGGHDPS